MAPAVGVVHLGDHMAQPAVAVVAPKDAERIEDIAEHARLQQGGDAALGSGQTAVGEEGAEPVAQRALLLIVEVIRGAEPGERSQPPGQPRQLVDVDIPAVASVFERMMHRGLS